MSATLKAPLRQRSKSVAGFAIAGLRPSSPLNLTGLIKATPSEQLTPPSSRRTSLAKPDNHPNLNAYKFPSAPTLKVVVSDIDNNDTTSGVGEPETPASKIPVSPLASKPRQSMRHQRAKSDAGFLPRNETESTIPGFQRSTKLSRSRSRSRAPSISQDAPSETRNRRDSSTKGTNLTICSPEEAAHAITTSTFKAAIDAINSNIMRISTEPGFRLEIRLLGAANTVELVAVPLPDVPSAPLVTWTPPVSPSTLPILDKDIDFNQEVAPELGLSTTAGVDIPALNIYSPTELECTSPVIPGPASLPQDTNELQEEKEIPSPPAPAPKSAEQHLEVVSQFIEKRNIAEFFRPSVSPASTTQESSSEDYKTGFLEALSTRAAVITKKLEKAQTSGNGAEEENSLSFIKDVSTVADVVKLSLYDHVVLCDDSGSMDWFNGIDPLKSCLNSISKIAIALTEPLSNVDDNNTTSTHGISIRFLNHRDDSSMNNLTSLSEIEDAVSKVNFSGGTMLGHALRQKILEPFLVNPIQRQNKRLRKPLLVTIITDGAPSGEDRDELKKTILWAKKYMESMGYGPWAVGFHIAQVGNFATAEEFLRELEEDDEINEHVYVSRENGDRTGWLQAKNNDLLWVNALLKAIEH